MTPLTFQREVHKLLSLWFQQVETEWRAITNISGIYSPRIDIAVGPFSVVPGGNCIGEYEKLINQSSKTIENLIFFHNINIQQYRISDDPRVNEGLSLPTINTLKNSNLNARCFLAIEIENEVSRKHLFGGTVNAAALGRIGVMIGWTKEKVLALVRLQAYWDFLGSVQKNTYRTNNLLILSPDQMQEALTTY